jgi:malate dehydrogenase (oxaloacetate-decarboxylating)
VQAAPVVPAEAAASASPAEAETAAPVTELEPAAEPVAEPADDVTAATPAAEEHVRAEGTWRDVADGHEGPAKTKWVALDGCWETTQRGREVMTDSRLYRGLAFTLEERRQLGIIGLIPPQIISVENQVTRSKAQYENQPTDLAKHTFLTLLRDRNEVLFYRLICDNLTEIMPIVYTPTVADAIAHYSAEYRRPQGVYLSVDHPEDIEASLAAPGLGADDVDLLVITDGEAILGIGDWGVGGIGISVGKLALYTAAGGIDPGRAIPIVIDAGTNRESLLEDPLYVGNKHARVDQVTYEAFVDSFVETASRMFPNALLHWEDLTAGNARGILNRWRDNTFTFNDDMQGTGAVVLAAVMSALRKTGARMSEQKVIVYGAGTAGIGIAEQLRDAMVADGLSKEEATRRFWCIGRTGLLTESLDDLLRDFQRPFARPDAEMEGWAKADDGSVDLTEVIRHVEATILIGTSGQPGAFTEDAIRAMALKCDHPIILPLSNPSNLAEAEPYDLMQWTGGRAMVATGSPFDPVTYAWSTHYIAQANNALVFPGLGLGATLVGAIQVTDNMLLAAAEAISSLVDMSIDGSPLLPEIENIRRTSMAVAAAVGQAAIDEGVARWALPDPLYEGIEAAMWTPDYRPIRAV